MAGWCQPTASNTPHLECLETMIARCAALDTTFDGTDRGPQSTKGRYERGCFFHTIPRLFLSFTEENGTPHIATMSRNENNLPLPTYHPEIETCSVFFQQIIFEKLFSEISRQSTTTFS